MFRLRNRLLLTFVGLAVGPLIVVTAILSRYTYENVREDALASQGATAEYVGTQIKTFVQTRENELQLLASNLYGLSPLPQDERTALLDILIANQPVYQELAILDENGAEQTRSSRNGIVQEGRRENRADQPEFMVPASTRATYYSPVYFDPSTYEPLMTMAVPVFNIRTGNLAAVVVADFRLKAIWNLIASLNPREGESIYVVDTVGHVIAHQNPSVVLRGTTFDASSKDGLTTGLAGTNVLLVSQPIDIGNQSFRVVVERSVTQAFQLALNLGTATLMVTVVALLIAVALVTGSVTRIVRPLVSLAAAARAISAGDLSKRVTIIKTRDEIEELAVAFNRMTEQLARSWADLQRQVHDLEVAQRALEESEQRSRNIIESIPLGFCTYELDARGRLILTGTNPAAEKLLKIRPEQAVGRALAEIFPWMQETDELANYEQTARQGRFWQTQHTTPLGIFEIYAFQTTPGKMVIAFQEITERKQAELQIQERAKRLELVARVGQQTTAILDLDDLLHRAVHLISDTFHYYNVIIRLVKDEEIVLRASTLPAFLPLEGRHGYAIGAKNITGWVVAHGNPLYVPDVTQDERYSFVLEGLQTRSELAVPIQSKGTVIGVLDVQSTESRAFSDADISTLQIVADQLAITIDNSRLYERVQNYAAELEQRVHERTAELASVNQELEAFAYSVSHDLRAPLRSIDGFSQALLEDYQQRLDSEGQDYLRRVRAASQRMSQLIDDLLVLSRISRREMHREHVDLSELAAETVRELQQQDPDRSVEVLITSPAPAYGDVRLLRVLLENLLGNAWKFTSKTSHARIEFGYTEGNGQKTYYVRDNGAGFDMTYAGKLFGAFQRLHAETEFEGTGIGLATVQRIVHRHGGRVWAEGIVDQGATFYFTL